MNRIVSLIASSTEIVCALGLEDRLVGRSHECDYPLSVSRLPVCTAPKFATEGTSGEIDRRVKGLLQQALSIYRVDADLLKQLRPTHIITQTQCEVCAVSLKEVEAALRDWITPGAAAEASPILIPLAPNALSDIWADIRRVADAMGVSERGRALVQQLQERMAAIAKKNERPAVRPRAAAIEWIDPLMAGGNWMPELIGMAGGVNLFGEAGKHSPWMTWEALIQADPDVILILPCGFDIPRTRKELPALTAHPAWPALKAVREKQVYLLDGNQYFNRPGPRLAESLEILAEIFHPDRFRFGHEGTGWIRI
ncbi:cobalamin-binding protein [Candidatus Manganitrophus noduliformans]|uniref:Cobalamin-binding protein n=1 Tax=Candidatus Manganitrophus noduliformans TaxID=2606439 RepID=A0A7X6DQA0_9BACT|nr:cobalamin-binding protein [Candidatus Manganitrophus noduliformans]NKE71370.1 cobalamin-binding protein [Candidatus Manganitrophus noduliformans]